VSPQEPPSPELSPPQEPPSPELSPPLEPLPEPPPEPPPARFAMAAAPSRGQSASSCTAALGELEILCLTDASERQRRLEDGGSRTTATGNPHQTNVSVVLLEVGEKLIM
jgi:hypothetical protein